MTSSLKDAPAIMAKSSTPVVFIGLDSGEPSLLRKWMASGDLPVLARFRDGGVWGDTNIFSGFGNGVLWPSLFTGVNPAKHGRTWFQQLVPGTYRVEAFRDDEDFTARPMWEAFGEAGKQCAIVDVVRAPLSRQVSGVQICDWLTHDRNSPPRSWPPKEIEDVLATFGDDPFEGRCDIPGLDAEGMDKLTSGLIDRVGVKTRYLKALLGRQRWDFLMTAYAEPHDIGHMCWHIHDETDPAHDPEIRARTGDPLKRVYVAIDQALGELLEILPAETTVIVFAGPGMRKFASCSHLLDKILLKLEEPGAGLARGVARHRLRNAWRRFAPRRLRHWLRSGSYRMGEALRASESRHRSCFTIPNNDEFGSIRINVVGREPHGRIRPGVEYDAYCDRLGRELMEIVDLATGEPIIKEIVRVSEKYSGPHLDRLPDLILMWNDKASPETVGSPRIGEISGRHEGIRTGDHSDRCFFVVRGPTVRAGEIVGPVPILDFAATIPHMLGVEVPRLEGKPLQQMLAVPEATFAGE